MQLSFHYKQIKHFIQQEQQPADGHKSKYRSALCTGIDGTQQQVLARTRDIHHSAMCSRALNGTEHTPCSDSGAARLCSAVLMWGGMQL